jgi:hypothetical protein
VMIAHGKPIGCRGFGGISCPRYHGNRARLWLSNR